MAITTLPIATASSSSQSWRPEPPRARFRTAWETSYGPSLAAPALMVGSPLHGRAGFLAQTLAAVTPAETLAEPSSALARYRQAAVIGDPIRAGDPMFFRATL